MTSVVFGLATALIWGVTSLTGARASRLLGAGPTLAWVSILGLMLVGPFAVADSRNGVDLATLLWIALAGVANVFGLLFGYAAVRRGKVGLAAPITSTEGAIAAVIAVIGGEAIAPLALAAMAIIVVGVILATLDFGAREVGGLAVTPTFLIFAIGAAICFGVGLYSGGRVSGDAPEAWIVVSARLAGTLVVAVPLVLARRLTMTRVALPWILVTAVAEVLGYTAYVLGARESIATTAVLASQFAALAVLGAYVFFRERLRRSQWLGVVLICFGVAAVAALSS